MTGRGVEVRRKETATPTIGEGIVAVTITIIMLGKEGVLGGPETTRLTMIDATAVVIVVVVGDMRKASGLIQEHTIVSPGTGNGPAGLLDGGVPTRGEISLSQPSRVVH